MSKRLKREKVLIKSLEDSGNLLSGIRQRITRHTAKQLSVDIQPNSCQFLKCKNRNILCHIFHEKVMGSNPTVASLRQPKSNSIEILHFQRLKLSNKKTQQILIQIFYEEDSRICLYLKQRNKILIRIFIIGFSWKRVY